MQTTSSKFSLSVSPPSPLTQSQAMCVACGLDSCPWTIEQGPPVCCFPHSSALTSAPVQEERCLNTPSGCVREEAPPPQPPPLDPGSLAGGPPVPSPLSDSRGTHYNTIKGMLYIPHVVLRYKLDGDAQRSLRWISPPSIDEPYGNLGHMLNVNIMLCKICSMKFLACSVFGLDSLL